jgi:hypothetical protein
MGFPKKIKKNLPLTIPKTLYPRREELVEKINQDGTFLPKSILHADLDRGFLDFVKDELMLSVDGVTVPVVDIIITTQNWAQFTETWNFVDLDFNVAPPFITTVRVPEVKFGTNPSTKYNIPNRRQYFYVTVPSWDGNRVGADVYKIPQPIPVDITYQVKIICNRMRELNDFNEIVLGKFASRQAYTTIKGHYIPITWNNITDESVLDLDKRKYYVQSYEFLMQGFLINEDEFTVSPAVNRLIQIMEIDTSKSKRGAKKKFNTNPNIYDSTYLFPSGVTEMTKTFELNVNLNFQSDINVLDYDVYVNNNYYGQSLLTIELNSGDSLKLVVTKDDNTKSSELVFSVKIF